MLALARCVRGDTGRPKIVASTSHRRHGKAWHMRRGVDRGHAHATANRRSKRKRSADRKFTGYGPKANFRGERSEPPPSPKVVPTAPPTPSQKPPQHLRVSKTYSQKSPPKSSGTSRTRSFYSCTTFLQLYDLGVATISCTTCKIHHQSSISSQQLLNTTQLSERVTITHMLTAIGPIQAQISS